jgi:hypothetical protein
VHSIQKAAVLLVWTQFTMILKRERESRAIEESTLPNADPKTIHDGLIQVRIFEVIYVRIS